jgi:ribonuclease Z
VAELVLTHVGPRLPSRLFHPAFLGDAAQRFGGRIRIADDGLRLFLPAGSRAIEADSL